MQPKNILATNRDWICNDKTQIFSLNLATLHENEKENKYEEIYNKTWLLM